MLKSTVEAPPGGGRVMTKETKTTNHTVCINKKPDARDCGDEGLKLPQCHWHSALAHAAWQESCRSLGSGAGWFQTREKKEWREFDNFAKVRT